MELSRTARQVTAFSSVRLLTHKRSNRNLPRQYLEHLGNFLSPALCRLPTGCYRKANCGKHVLIKRRDKEEIKRNTRDGIQAIRKARQGISTKTFECTVSLLSFFFFQHRLCRAAVIERGPPCDPTFSARTSLVLYFLSSIYISSSDVWDWRDDVRLSVCLLYYCSPPPLF